MPDSSSIACVSRDALLLETRSQVLATRYRVLRAGSVEELAALSPAEPIHLVLLCHTLSPDECRLASEIARSCWPTAVVLALSAPSSECDGPLVDAVMQGEHSPALLLSSIAKLLHTRRVLLQS